MDIKRIAEAVRYAESLLTASEHWGEGEQKVYDKGGTAIMYTDTAHGDLRVEVSKDSSGGGENAVVVVKQHKSFKNLDDAKAYLAKLGL